MCESGRAHRSGGDLLVMEFGMEEDNSTVKQFSPVKPHCGSGPLARPGGRRLFGEAGAGASPTAVAEPPGIASQPSSATSSLAAALADLQVSSRQSSASDLGDRSRLLASVARPAGGRHSRCASRDELPGLAPEDSLCSTMLIGAVRSFDTMVLKTLTPIKTRGRASGGGGGSARGDGGTEPPAPPLAGEPLPSPFSSLRPKGTMGGRPIVFHSRSSSGLAAPGAYLPYDASAAILSSEFRSPAKALYSPYPASSQGSAAATPNQWGSGSYRGASYRALAAQQALAQARDDEPDYYVSVPGVRRQQSLTSRSGTLPVMAQDGAAAPTAASPAAPQRGPSPGPALQASSGTATLGSGTTVHGFKGLFRTVITRGPSQ